MFPSQQKSRFRLSVGCQQNRVKHLRGLTQERQAWNRANPTGPANTELPHTFLAAFFSMAFGTRSPAAVGAMDYVRYLAERPCFKRAGLKGCGKGGRQEKCECHRGVQGQEGEN